MRHPQKIMIFGRPGSGKSTFALRLHQLTQIPLHHIDKHFFEGGWQKRDETEFNRIMDQIIATPAWIIDGNNTKALEKRWGSADLVIYCNFPRWICVVRIIKRLFHKDPAIDDRAVGCPEKLRWRLLTYMWTFEARVAEPIKALKARYPTTPFVEVFSDNDYANLLNRLIEGDSNLIRSSKE